MPGAGLLEIKRRMNSVTNTRKITKAMGLVATSKLRKMKNSIRVNEIYYNNFNEVANYLLNSLGESGENIFITKNDDSKNKLFVLICSDTGLCGGFNASVASYLEGKYGVIKDNISVIIIGRRGIPYIKKNGYKTVSEYVDIGELPTTKEASIISNKIVSEFKKGHYGEIKLIYTMFKSAVIQEVIEENLLPIDNNVSKKDDLYSIECNSDDGLEDIVKSYLLSKIIHGLFHSKTSENTARMQAMENASKNADDILSELSIKYNRIRQSIITQEISEIVGGAEAQR